ncbi:NAD(P)H-dependent oxidoreductase [Eubacteriales bacterium KG127]
MDINKLKNKKRIKILFVDACLRGNESRTGHVARHLLNELKKKWAGLRLSLIVDYLYLDADKIQPFNNEKILKRNDLIAKGQFDNPMFEYANQLKSADILIIAAPCWDMSFPSILKVYIENLVVFNLTFTTKDNFFEGLCNVQKTYFVSTSGGDILRQPFGLDYIKGIADMLSLGPVIPYMTGNLDIEGENPDEIVHDLMDKISSDLCD